MDIQLDYDSSISGAPAGLTTAMAAAANAIDALITNPITVTIQVGWGEYQGTSVGGDAGEGGPSGEYVTYAQLRSYLAASATSASDQSAVQNLPAGDPTNGGSFFITQAQEKAWGLLPAAAGGIDGTVAFGTAYPWNFDPSAATVANELGFVGVAEHELTHVLGRLDLLQDPPNAYSPLDLFRYSAPGALELAGGAPAYFSIDGGHTALDSFATTDDYSDWSGAKGPDSFNAVTQYGQPNAMTAADITEMDVLGFNIAAKASFTGTDTTTGRLAANTPEAYSGPVAGVQNEYVDVTSDSLNISVASDNWFIHTGSGMDAIAVHGGTNVLDGGTGSNFLVGGSGTDTFFVDDRSAQTAMWSTVVGFHAGDSATVWGVTAQDFERIWADAQGAAGFTGLTLHATAADKPTASLTLAGYEQADLNNGRLSVLFGTDQASGSPYLSIHANG